MLNILGYDDISGCPNCGNDIHDPSRHRLCRIVEAGLAATVYENVVGVVINIVGSPRVFVAEA
jgi:hypothetical protein